MKYYCVEHYRNDYYSLSNFSEFLSLSFQIFTLSLKMRNSQPCFVEQSLHFCQFFFFSGCIITLDHLWWFFSIWLCFQSQYFQLVLVYNFYIYFTYVFMKACQRPSPLSTNMSELLKSPYGQLNSQMPISSFSPSRLNEHLYSVRCLVK